MESRYSDSIRRADGDIYGHDSGAWTFLSTPFSNTKPCNINRGSNILFARLFDIRISPFLLSSHFQDQTIDSA